jgi:hypothetical protein
MARKLHHWQITSYAYKKDPSGSTAPGIDYHNQKKTALLDNPEPFLEHGGQYGATVDTSAKKLNESYFEHPMSGDDIAKMGGRRISMKPTLKHWVDVRQDLDHYEDRRREAQNAETPPDRGSDPSRRPSMGGY